MNFLNQLLDSCFFSFSLRGADEIQIFFANNTAYE